MYRAGFPSPYVLHEDIDSSDPLTALIEASPVHLTRVIIRDIHLGAFRCRIVRIELTSGLLSSYAPPPGPPPPGGPGGSTYPGQHHHHHHHQGFAPPSGPPPGNFPGGPSPSGGYAPPPGPPPGGYASPSGPPPGGYASPSGPPPVPPRWSGAGGPPSVPPRLDGQSAPAPGRFAPPGECTCMVLRNQSAKSRYGIAGPPPRPPTQQQHYGPTFEGANHQRGQPFFQYSQCTGKKRALCVSPCVAFAQVML